MTLRQKATAAAILAIAAATCVYYYLVDPAEGAAPRCLLRALTGYDCPGCGTQRALHALLHGHFRRAWGYNPAAIVAVPLAAAYIITEAMPGRFRRVARVLYHPAFILGVAAAIVAWWLLRNLI